MAEGLDDVLEELRAATDEIAAFPGWLIERAMGRGPVDLVRRVDRLGLRLPALRCLVDVREIGKALRGAPAWEAATTARFIEEFEASEGASRHDELRATLNLTEQGLAEVAATIRATTIGGAPEAVRAIDAIGRAAAIYRGLQDTSAEVLLTSRALPEIADHMDRLGQAGHALVAQVDRHRRLLEDGVWS